ncbi:hypothetical protein [Scytonema millei]|uniref:Uncharacterized protein n=1 Tax=Scytonema millei VB511283 TaxID=1245923 RepID=A0A9X5E5S3_9CYAN|nr:hypothetical protein [Scytonema millei]NHC35328.1 hypothetical protein [Scytonema millei VB511283]
MIQAFVPCAPSVSLLTADVGGVSDPFTGEYGAGTQREDGFPVKTQRLRSRVEIDLVLDLKLFRA